MKLTHFYDKTGKRYYAESQEAFDSGRFYIGVTTILDHIYTDADKKFISGVPENVRNKVMKTAAGIGTDIHALVEADLNGSPLTVIPPECKVGYDRWLLAKETHSIQALHTEKVLWHKDLWYAGTADIIGSITDVAKGKVYNEAIMDLKTGRTFHKAKFAMQTAAYMCAYKTMGGNPDGRVIIQTPRTEDVRPTVCFYAADEPNYRAFLGALEVFKLMNYYPLKAMHWQGLDVVGMKPSYKCECITEAA